MPTFKSSYLSSSIMVVNQRCNKEVLQNQYTKKSKLIVVKDQESKTVVKKILQTLLNVVIIIKFQCLE